MGWAQILLDLRDANILAYAFGIGALALLIAIIGRFGQARIGAVRTGILAVFGLCLMMSGLLGYIATRTSSANVVVAQISPTAQQLTPPSVPTTAVQNIATSQPPQPADTQPPPAPMTPTLLPAQTLSSGQTGIPIPDGTTMPAGSSVIVREVYFDKREAKVWWTPATTEPITFGAGVLGAPGWNRDGWYATTAWPRQALEACQEAQRIVNGSLGGSGWEVTLQNSNVPATCP